MYVKNDDKTVCGRRPAASFGPVRAPNELCVVETAADSVRAEMATVFGTRNNYYYYLGDVTII